MGIIDFSEISRTSYIITGIMMLPICIIFSKSFIMGIRAKKYLSFNKNFNENEILEKYKNHIDGNTVVINFFEYIYLTMVKAVSAYGHQPYDISLINDAVKEKAEKQFEKKYKSIPLLNDLLPPLGMLGTLFGFMIQGMIQSTGAMGKGGLVIAISTTITGLSLFIWGQIRLIHIEDQVGKRISNATMQYYRTNIETIKAMSGNQQHVYYDAIKDDIEKLLKDKNSIQKEMIIDSISKGLFTFFNGQNGKIILKYLAGK